MSKVGKIEKKTNTRFLNFYEFEAVFRDGRTAPYYVASRAKSIDKLKAVTGKNRADGVILYGVYGEKKDKVVLIRQYRFPLGGYVYEFPAGLVELEPAHFSKLPVWSEGNVYLSGAKASRHEVNGLVVDNEDVKVELVEKDGKYYLDTNIYEFLKGFGGRMVNTELLGKAFEPEQPFENPDGTPIQFDADYFGGHRGLNVIPGPFANVEDAEKVLF